MSSLLAKRGVLPGFGLSLGYTLLYLGLMILLPMAALVVKASSMGVQEFFASALDARALAAYRLSFGLSFAAAAVNGVFGVLLAWVLVRYEFPGRKLLDAMIDLPFALPTAVAGIALTALYAPTGILGEPLANLGLQVAYRPLGIFVALTFTGMPFVVRTVQPVLEELDASVEEASAILGADRWLTFRRVIFPTLVPSLLTGFALAFARGVGEYGSVVFISGNMPMKTEIAPLLIITKLEQYDYAGATAIATVLLCVSFLSLFSINVIQRKAARWL